MTMSGLESIRDLLKQFTSLEEAKITCPDCGFTEFRIYSSW